MRKNRTFIGFIIGALLVGAVGFLSSGFLTWNPDDWRDKIIPSVTSEDPVSVDDSIDTTSDVEEPISDTSEEELNAVMELPEMVMTEEVFNFSFSEITGGLSASFYRNSTGELNGFPVSYNSLRLIKNNEIYDLRFGFPSTTTNIHTDTEFTNALTYTSYLKYEFKHHNKYGFVINGRTDSDLKLAYRTNLETQWNYFDLTVEDMIINGDNLYYQFALVYSSNNKSSNITSQVDFENISLVILKENEIFRTIKRNIYVYETERIFNERDHFVSILGHLYHDEFIWDEPNNLFTIQTMRSLDITDDFVNFKTYKPAHLYIYFDTEVDRDSFRATVNSFSVNNKFKHSLLEDLNTSVVIDKENNLFEIRPAIRLELFPNDESDITINFQKNEIAVINADDILVDELGEYVMDNTNGWKNYLE